MGLGQYSNIQGHVLTIYGTLKPACDRTAKDQNFFTHFAQVLEVWQTSVMQFLHSHHHLHHSLC